MKKKTIIIIALAVVLLSAAAIFLLPMVTGGGQPVDVLPVAQLNVGWYGGSEFAYGMIVTEMSQQVLHDAALSIKEILVRPGDFVKVGDPLIHYDVTLTEIQMQLKQVEIRQKELEIKQRNKNLKTLQSGKLPASSSFFAPASLSQPHTAPLSGRALRLGAAAPAPVPIDATAHPYDGDGTEATPYLYLCPAGSLVTQDFVTAQLNLAVSETRDVHVKLETREGDALDGALLYTFVMVFHPDGTFDLTVSLPSDIPEPLPEPTPEPEPLPPPGPSKEQLADMIAQVKKQLRDDELALRQAQMDLKKLEAQGADGIIKSTVNGTVKKVGDPATLSNQEVLIDVTGGNGYYVDGYIGEISLAQVSLGMALNVRSYNTNTTYTGRVVEIGDVPYTTMYGENNNYNTSGYRIKIAIDAPGVEFMPYEGVSLSLMGQTTDPSAVMGLCLERAYVREKDGVSFVYAVRDGVLRRQDVSTGRSMWNAVEIVSGLTMEDYIAFPYGKDVREGAPIKMPEGYEGSPGRVPGRMPGVIIKG